MIFPRFLILIFVSFLFVAGVAAQDKNYVYRDTAIVELDSAERSLSETGELVDDVGESDEEEVIYIDTSLVDNGLGVLRDSLADVRDQAALSYAKNLDSLLNAHQEKQQLQQSKTKQGPSWLERFFFSSFTMYFFWILAGIFIAFILYKLFFAEGFFQRNYKKAPVTMLQDPEEKLSRDTDYQRLVNAAIRDKNYRLAIRYHYLQSLQKMAEKSLIEYTPDKTNYEYLREISGKKFKTDFAGLTRNYEYAWYGEFDISEPVFEKIQQKFKQFYSVIH